MNLGRKTQLSFTIATLGIILFVLIFFVHKQGRISFCKGCYSMKQSTGCYLGTGSDDSLPLGRENAQITTSQLYRDLLTQDHSHEWQLNDLTSRRLLGGKLPPSSPINLPSSRYMVDQYETDPDFRRYIREEIDKGTITRAQAARELVFKGHACPPPPGPTVLEKYFLSKP